MEPERGKALLKIVGIIGGLAAATWLVVKLTKPLEMGAQAISVHPHGEHTCYCPKCGETKKVEENVQCYTQYCSKCGTRMRAVETGEYR
jgi:NADH pyrophosphatase NudC (nudix superfamily)